MKEDIKNYIQDFKKWVSQTPEGKRWEQEREERLKFFKEKIKNKRIDNLTEKEFEILIKGLWAINFWRNKDYFVQRLIKDNGFEKIKQELKKLLYGEEELKIRWDNFRNSIKGLGPSSINEILAFFNPKEYALINMKDYKVLPRLGISINPVRDGKSYQEAIEKLKKVRDYLKEGEIENADFLVTDFFIAYLFYNVFGLAYERKEKTALEAGIEIEEKEAKKKIKLKKIKIDSHEKAEAVLLILGKLLGYDTYTPDKGRNVEGQKLGDIATLKELPYFGSEKIMEIAENIDVVWTKEEWPEMFFEVEHTTGVTSGLLRIYQVAEKLSAKCFIVAPPEMIQKFKKETEKTPFSRIKDKYKFKSYKDIEKIYLATKEFKEIFKKFFDE